MVSKYLLSTYYRQSWVLVVRIVEVSLEYLRITVALKVNEVTHQALQSLMMQRFPWSRETKCEIEAEESVCKMSTRRQRQTSKEDKGVEGIRGRTEE